MTGRTGEIDPVVALLRRDRILVAASLILVSALSWGYIVLGAGMDASASIEAMATPMAWSPGYAVIVFFMWWIMMVAMMLPSASPTIMLFAQIGRRQRELGKPFVSTSLFAAGYLLVWGGFSLAAAALQWALERGELLSMMESATALLSGAILIAAGLWQLTPLKQACLRHCRSPLHFLTHKFRAGGWGAVRMGLEHGLFCLGCCWFLMGLLFYGGVMNLYWIIGLAAYVLIEKLAPKAEWISKAAGIALLLWGGTLLGSL
jgi:predicted metal-binding membrane protein